MDELGIGADGNDLGIQFFEFIILLRQSSELGRSHEREIGGVEEEDGPCPCRFPGGNTDLVEIAFRRVEDIKFEIGHCLPYLDPAAIA
jgi:hypothetical protein